MSAPLTMAEAAREVGLSYERFRKVWRQLPGFPAPIRGRAWDADAIAAWKAERSRPADVVAFAGRKAPAAAAAARAQLAALRRA